MYLLSLAIMFFSVNAQAAVSETVLQSALMSQSQCGNFVRHDNERLFFGFGSYGFGLGSARDPYPNKFRTVDLLTHVSRDYATLDSVVDVVAQDSVAYVLTYTSVEEWDLKAHRRIDVYPTHVYNQGLGRNQHAVAMAGYGSYLLIAHGRLGVMVFDTVTKSVVGNIKFAQDRLPLESKVTGIAVRGDFAFLSLDSHHLTRPPQKAPFVGIAIIDLINFEVVSELDGMDIGSDAVVADDDFVVISFGGRPIWKYDRKALLVAKTLPVPLEYIWKYPGKGHPTRKPLMTESLYLTCYMMPPPPGSANKLYKNVPMVIERAHMKLGR